MSDTFLADVARVEEQDRVRRQQGTARTAAQSLVQVQGVSPESAAAAARAGAFLGLPAPAVRADPTLVQDARVQQDRQTLTTAPHTANAYTDPEFAVVAHDQVGPLAGLERLVDGIFGKGKFDANVDTARRFGGDLLTGIGSGFSGLATTAQTIDRYAIPGLPRYSPAASVLNEVGSSFKAAGGDVSGTQPLYFPRNSGVDTGLAGDVVGGLGQITGQVLVGAGTGGTATLPFLYGQGVDQMNDRVVADMAADGRTERTAADDLAAQAGGLVTAATEKIGLDRILHAVPSAVKNNLMRRLTDIAVAGITEGTTEALEQVGQNALSINLLGTPGGLANYVDGAPDAAAPASLVGSIARLAVQAAIPGVQHVHTANAAATATADHAAFEQAVEAVTSNPLLERSPERFRQYLASATDNANVYVPAEAAREFFQSNPELDQWLDEWDIRDQYEQALVAGTDIAIPTATYLTQVAPTDAHAAFSQDLRLGPDAMSLREVQDFEAQGEENLGAAVDSAVQQGVQSQANEAPVERVKADIFDQLRSAGVSVEVARQNAVLVAARARTRAQRSPDLYPDAWAAYTADGGLKVQAEVPASVQRERDRLDVVIEVMRNRNGAPTQRALKGQTLLEFLSDNGGVTDTGGELAAMGAGAFNRPSQGGRSGRRPVIRTEGGNAFGSDYAAQRAVEAGYLPEGSDGNALFNAMREELAGRPVYSATYARDAAAESTVEAASDLEALLPTLGLDANATNDEIRAAVAKMGDASAGGFNQDDDALGPKRGNIRFTDAGATITLFKAKDRSTFLHEISHKWLDELVIDATHESASPEVKADLDKVLAWFSENAGKPITVDDIGVDQHELWARGGEVFFLEGKAPSAELRPAFKRFTEWLKGIYRSVVALNAPVSQPVREVMGRLIATDEEIDSAIQAQSLGSLFYSADAAGMSKTEYAAWTKLETEAKARAEATALRQVMEPLKRKLTMEYKNRREELRERQTEIVDAMPDIAAIRMLNESGDRLNREALTEMYGSDRVLKLLPKGKAAIYAADGAYHPDALAELVGARSGEDLVNALMGNAAERQARKAQNDNRSVRDGRIEDRLDEEMRFLEGDPLTDGTIDDIAMQAAHNRVQMEVMTRDATRLYKMGGQRVLYTREGIEAYAEATIANLRVGRLRPNAYLRTERSEGLKAQRLLAEATAMKDGDAKAKKHVEAGESRLRQSINHALYREATKAQTKFDRDLDYMRKLSRQVTHPTIEQDHFDQIHGILDTYDLREMSGLAVQRTQALGEWLEKRDASGLFTPFVAEKVREQLTKKPYSTLTVDEFSDVADTVRSIAKLGRDAHKVRIAGELVEMNAAIDRLYDSASYLPDQKAKEEFGRPVRFWDRTASWASKADAAHTKMQTVMALLDNNNPEGVLTQMLDVGYVEAENRRYDLREKFLNPVAEAERAIPNSVKKTWLNRVEVPGMLNPKTGLPFAKYRRKDLIALALQVGNLGNFEKTAAGYGMLPARYDEFSIKDHRDSLVRWLDTKLDPSEWRYVQTFWDAFEAQRADYFETVKRMTGVDPVAVKAVPLQTSAGPLAGGYVPVSYDRDLDPNADEQAKKDEAETFDGTFQRAKTSTGNAKERTKYTGPVDLTLERIWSDANKMITHIAFGEFISSAQKFTRNPRVRSLIEAKVGIDKYREIEPWLQRIVRDNGAISPASGWLARTLRGSRANVSAAALLGSATVLLSQPAGLTQGAAELGGVAVAGGIMKAASLEATGQFDAYVFKRSDFMRQRLAETGDRDLRDAVRMAKTQDEALARSREWAAKAIAAMDVYVVSGPIWIAAYDGAIDDGRSEKVAVQIADRAVRKTQGSSRPGDAAGIQGGDEILKTMTFAYGWANALYNQQREAVVNIATGRDPLRSARSLMWLMLAGPLASAVLSGDWPEPEDGESWLEAASAWVTRKVFFNTFSGMVLARDISSFAERKIAGKYAGSPMQGHLGRIVGEVDQLANDAWKAAHGEDVSSKWPSDVINGVGYSFGVPGTAQLARSVQYGYEVKEGDQNPENPFDWVMGLYKGPQESQK